MKLEVQINANAVREDANFVLPNGNMILMTPAIDEKYWLLRVPVSEKQAVVCFPKFFTIGCGFQHEEDWNRNLPLSCPTEKIFGHIKHNKGDRKIKDADCRTAIDMLREKAIELGMIQKQEVQQ